MLATGTESDLYKFVLLLHILGVVVGIGGVTLNALYGLEARKRSRPGGGARAVVDANYAVSVVANYVIYTIIVTGALLVVLSDDAWTFGQLWVWLAIVLYVIALGIAHAVLRRNARRISSLLGEIEAGPPPVGGPPPQAAELGRIGQQQGIAGTVVNLLTVALVALMIWKPGA
jgi:uncharacterized membrane protein